MSNGNEGKGPHGGGGQVEQEGSPRPKNTLDAMKGRLHEFLTPQKRANEGRGPDLGAMTNALNNPDDPSNLQNTSGRNAEEIGGRNG